MPLATKLDLESVKNELKTEIREVRTELKLEIKETKYTLLKWQLGIAFTIISVNTSFTMAMFKFFMGH